MGEHEQFEALFLPYLDAAYNLARWIVRNDEDAQDVVQEAYLRAFKGFRGFRGGNNRAWLLTIVRNSAITWAGKYVNQTRTVPYEEEKHAELLSIVEPSDNGAIRKEYLQKALERLPVEFREVIILFEFEGLSYKELASAVGVPLGTVMSRLSRARLRLKQECVQISNEEEEK